MHMTPTTSPVPTADTSDASQQPAPPLPGQQQLFPALPPLPFTLDLTGWSELDFAALSAIPSESPEPAAETPAALKVPPIVIGPAPEPGQLSDIQEAITALEATGEATKDLTEVVTSLRQQMSAGAQAAYNAKARELIDGIQPSDRDKELSKLMQDLRYWRRVVANRSIQEVETRNTLAGIVKSRKFAINEVMELRLKLRDLDACDEGDDDDDWDDDDSDISLVTEANVMAGIAVAKQILQPTPVTPTNLDGKPAATVGATATTTAKAEGEASQRVYEWAEHTNRNGVKVYVCPMCGAAAGGMHLAGCEVIGKQLVRPKATAKEPDPIGDKLEENRAEAAQQPGTVESKAIKPSGPPPVETGRPVKGDLAATSSIDALGLTPSQIEKLEGADIKTIGNLEAAMRMGNFVPGRIHGVGQAMIDKITDKLMEFRRRYPVPAV